MWKWYAQQPVKVTLFGISWPKPPRFLIVLTVFGYGVLVASLVSQI